MPKIAVRPESDGITHVNVFSGGKTRLGRFLSNFAFCPIVTDDGPFDSVEGYWYWLSSVGEQKDRLRKLAGAEAKELGRALGASDWCDEAWFQEKIKKAIDAKLRARPEMLEELRSTRVPLTHYYAYGDKIIKVTGGKWVIEHFDEIRRGKAV
jgi:hypothetical protein